ncbi:DUF819 family protein [Aliiglaciecola sp. 2_MG-2023]|uniref:DUF819 family protein n=1 Tax=unclassified Aliiglaciecola TaxID=2593648 RepID=UPI0026E3AC70|nr:MULTISPECIES: DUF819 family protein [unclassified Aliiglaciecola]MDO6710631.1 DUF819 family protein [Aliiglaciecola sp. 2_MG-2023]MDO6754282.1 DUF819 family protein [Aliiglaciecola sp. 1_MG-2023]
MISGDNIAAVCSVIFGLAWFGFWIDNFAIGKKISGVVCILGLGMLFSNLQLIPFNSPVYDFVGSNLVPLAIPLLLFKSNLLSIFKESGAVLVIFCIASMTTVFGAILGFYIFDLGNIGPKVAGAYTGGYVGGAVNFLAVSQVVEMSTDEFSAAISASSIVSIIALMILLAIPSTKWITKHFSSFKEGELKDQPDSKEINEHKVNFNLTHISGAICLSFVICALSEYLANSIGFKQYSFLIITALTLLIANVFPKTMGQLKGEFETGILLMYLFFAVVGIGTDMSVFIGAAIKLFFYGMFIIFIHLTVTFLLAKWFKFDLKETLVASAAALVGPAVTAAIATSNNWRTLVTPGIMCGILGYAIATFIGVTVTTFLS